MEFDDSQRVNIVVGLSFVNYTTIRSWCVQTFGVTSSIYLLIITTYPIIFYHEGTESRYKTDRISNYIISLSEIIGAF